MGENQTIQTLPLHDLHSIAGAKFGAFAGWNMPLSYPLGVLKEHLHVRENAGLFDISHMKLLDVSGPDAGALIAKACPLNANEMAMNASKYTFFLNENAGILDDLIVTRLGETRFMVVANAGCAAQDEAHLRALGAQYECRIEALDRVFLALQGPMAVQVMHDLGFDVESRPFMSGFEPQEGMFLTRSGYTGEDGFEIALPPAQATPLAQKLIDHEAVEWIGLAARDSLRLEAGLCLYGNDLDTQTDPLSAGLMWAIAKPLRETGQFVGADKLREIIAAGPSRKRVGLRAIGRQPVRGGVELSSEDGTPAGQVTSGGFGPSVQHPVAMGYVSTALATPGTSVQALNRGRKIEMQVMKLPFLPKGQTKGIK